VEQSGHDCPRVIVQRNPLQFGTHFVDIVLWTPDEREQIAWQTADAVYKLDLAGFSVASTVDWDSMFEESAA
jgi:hypothetical protein